MPVVRMAAWVVILVVRGVALWVLVPLTVLAYPVVRVLGNRVTLSETISWSDLNLVAALQRMFPPQTFKDCASFAGWRSIASG